jgi:hypothetical protein
MRRAAIASCLCLGSALTLPPALAQAQSLPQGLTCGVSYADRQCNVFGGNCGPSITSDNTCNGVHTLKVGQYFPSCSPCSACACATVCNSGNSCQVQAFGLFTEAAPGYTVISDGDIGNAEGYGFYHQELGSSGVTLPAPSADFVLPKGAACGLHHTFQPPRTCMGLDPAQACPDGWVQRKAFDMSSSSGFWVWCEYLDRNHHSIGGPAVSPVGIACGISHNASGEDPGPVCMGYRPVEASPPLCPSTANGSGWFDQGRPGGLGLGFCTTTSNVMPPPAPPRGSLETKTSTDGSFRGWAYDPNAPEASIFVDYYVDGPAGSGAPGFRTVANGSRPDVNSAFNILGDHGYTFTLPQQFLNNVNHTVYIYGIALFGQGNPQLAQSPGTYTAPPPPGCPSGKVDCGGFCVTPPQVCP